MVEEANIKYILTIFDNIRAVNPKEIESLYYGLSSVRVIVPSGEGRSKGALSIACSEIAKMNKGKIILDRSDIGFPGRDLYEAAPAIRNKYGPMSLLINSGSGKALIPLIDAQKLGQYITETGNIRDYRIDVVTSDPESPIGKLGSRYGSVVNLKGQVIYENFSEIKEFRETGILTDIFELGSLVLYQAIAEAMNKDASADAIFSIIENIFKEIQEMLEDKNSIEFIKRIVDDLEKRSLCFMGGLGSGLEVARMTAVRIGHIKRVLGDSVYVIRDVNLPVPRPGDIFIVISYSGETEVVVGWCKNFKKMGGKVISVVGNKNSSIYSLSDYSYVINSPYVKGEPNRFYLKAAFLLSPLPLFLAERIEKRGLRLPDYILRWYHSIISII
ncbi:MAG: SIS domain-containing protein [Thermoproteota archaeon]|nr:SIS domain-containing protein [Thermoproteota archaeon]